MRAIDSYTDKIEHFETMTFQERRDAVRKANLDDKQHTKSTLKAIFRVKPASDSVSEYSYKNNWGKYVECFTLNQCVNMREPSKKPRSKAQVVASEALANNVKAQSKESRAIELCKKLVEVGAVVIDTETTGLDGVAIQISAVCCKTRRVLYSSLIHTDEPISDGAYDVHGIDALMLDGAPSPEAVGHELGKILKDKTIVAFNSEFDHDICSNTFGNARFLQKKWTCAMYEIAVPAIGSTNRYGTISLSNAMEHAGVEWVGEAHDAEADCLGTVDLIKAIAEV
ncbi:exonuclease domain-containing protein [Vibrio cyclitrophicus]